MIGNPPYIKEYTNREAFDGFRHSPYYQGKMDIWYGFACKMIDLLRQEGVECFIVQNNWITSSGASLFREKAITESEIKLFTDFGNYKVFEAAGIQTMIYILKKILPSETYDVKYSILRNDQINKIQLKRFLTFENKNEYDSKFLVALRPESIKGKPFTFNDETASDVLNKIKGQGNFYLTEKEVAQGIVPNPDVVNSRNIKLLSNSKINVGDGVFVVPIGFFQSIHSIEKKYLKKIFEPKEVKKYTFVREYENEIIYITKSNYKNDAPTLLEHLKKFKAIMEERRENRNGRLDYFHLHWPRDENFFKEGEKILSVRKCQTPTFIYTKEPAYVMMSFNIIQTTRLSMKYLTALLNSKIIAYWLKHKGKMQGNNYQIDKEPLLSIPLIAPKDVAKIEMLVDKILLDKGKDGDSDIADFENEIDNLVYQLYNLTEEEIQIIEASI